ncbi:DUF6289 family protein (plasmid) [Pseudoalteromonas sp. T1lg65]|uniref:DUF6289 family protein n=1 Tax=Pseudoalteromonas sp. T1lg65 TaxID=2077101 RepID=UPI003F7A771E
MKTKIILFVVSTLIGLSATAASAYRSGSIIEFIYFDDNGMVVGERVINQCNRTDTSWGQVTSRKIVGSEPCDDRYHNFN